MTDVLLTHSYHLPDDAKQLRKMQPYAPLGTLYAAAAVREAGMSVAVFDTTLRDPRTQFKSAIRRHRPSIVVIYEDDFNFLSKMCLESTRDTARSIIQLCATACIPVVVHGSDATDNAAFYLEAGASFVLTGEAEQTLATLCTRMLRGEAPQDVPGLCWRTAEGTIVRSACITARNPAWAEAPRIGRELIDMEPYRRAWQSAHGRFSANIVASRGCPFQCNWCAKPISGNKYQLRPAVSVVQEIRELRELYGVQHLWFGDDIFALNRHWIREFAEACESTRCRVPYKIQSRADLMHPDVVDGLRRSGCEEVWMGVESGSQRILDAMDKQLKVADVHLATERLHAAGIRACFFLQFGYPGELWPDIEQTLALVRSARPHEIGVSLSYPLPGTVFYQRVRAELGPKRNWRDSDDLSVLFSGAYSSEFYRKLRDALHAEVASWREQPSAARVQSLWDEVRAMEPAARVLSAPTLQLSAPLVQLESWQPEAGRVQ